MNIPNFKFALREDLQNNKEFLPSRATTNSSGWDVACAWEHHAYHTARPGEWLKIPLGIRCIPEKGYWLEMKPRSSSFIKKNLHALYGTIDSDYRQQLYFCAKYDGDDDLKLEFGEKIGQIIPVKLQEMETIEISNEDFDAICAIELNNRVGGFGSSDKK